MPPLQLIISIKRKLFSLEKCHSLYAQIPWFTIYFFVFLFFYFFLYKGYNGMEDSKLTQVV